jgi:hypothetical protein
MSNSATTLRHHRCPSHPRRMTHSEFSILVNPGGAQQHQRTQPVTYNTPPNTKPAECVIQPRNLARPHLRSVSLRAVPKGYIDWNSGVSLAPSPRPNPGGVVLP